MAPANVLSCKDLIDTTEDNSDATIVPDPIVILPVPNYMKRLFLVAKYLGT